MTIETYVPEEVTFGGDPITETFALVLHDPDSDAAYGTLTTHHAPAEGSRGDLVVVGTRDGVRWRVTIDEVEVYRKTPVGCEFTILGPLARMKLGEA